MNFPLFTTFPHLGHSSLNTLSTGAWGASWIAFSSLTFLKSWLCSSAMIVALSVTSVGRPLANSLPMKCLKLLVVQTNFICLLHLRQILRLNRELENRIIRSLHQHPQEMFRMHVKSLCRVK